MKERIKKVAKIFLSFIILMLLTICCLFVENGSKKIDVTYAKSSSSSSDIQLMARAINGEARGEPYEGQVAVGAVILNRVKDSRFPNTIAGVIYQ